MHLSRLESRVAQLYRWSSWWLPQETREMHRDDVVEHMRAGILADVEWHKGVASMSGWTRELFGDL